MTNNSLALCFVFLWWHASFILLSDADLEGTMESSNAQNVGSSSGYGVKQRGVASNFLDKRGFGWLLEEEETGDDDDQPLL